LIEETGTDVSKIHTGADKAITAFQVDFNISQNGNPESPVMKQS
jgi:hypothetical protein